MAVSQPITNVHPPEDRKDLRIRQQAERLLTEGNYEEAIVQLNKILKYPEAANLKGVCLMRKGLHEHAVQWYRGFLLHTGTAHSRQDSLDMHIVNFATALLLSGRPAGCLEVLSEVRNQTLPGVVRLRQAVHKWSRTLGWWARFNWWLGKMEPDTCVVPIDFVPGEFASVIQPTPMPAAATTPSATTQSAMTQGATAAVTPQQTVL